MHRNGKNQTRLLLVEFLISAKARGGLRSPHFWIIAALLAAFGCVYYLVLDSFYDLYVILFFYPLLYAAITYRLRGVLVSGIAFLAIILPHAIIYIEDTSISVRLILFSLFAIQVSSLSAGLLNFLEQQVAAYKEILSLNEELNRYIKQLDEVQNQLIQSEKMSALGQLSASVAHEINNPMTGILVYTRLMVKKINAGNFDKNELLENLAKIENSAAYSSDIVHSLLDFARQTNLILKPVCISDIMDQVMSLVGFEADMKHIKVTIEEKSPVPPVVVDSSQIRHVFTNLVVNAIQATDEGGKLRISSSLNDDGFVKIEFEDTGCGIPPENMNRLFTPFFTTKEAVKGVGLGLSVSYGIVKRHNGRIEVKSEVGKGSTFTVYLPTSLQT